MIRSILEKVVMKMERFSYLRIIVCYMLLFFASNGFTFTIGLNTDSVIPPYFYGVFDDGGFSDWIWYGPSPEHPVSGNHEVLSGEWGAAIYYDGIDTDPIDPVSPERKAVWLTKEFLFPYWFTGSDLDTTATGAGTPSDNPANPAGKNGIPDTAQSTIANDDVEIQIDYEVVDLQYRDPNAWDPNDYLCRSPMGFLEPDEDDLNMLRSAYIYSDRYIFLQTYTIKNISGQTLDNLAFYQMLHSHGADEYDPYVSSTYNPIAYEDPLENYVPYDSIHCVPDSNTAGTFRFDITQWNEEDHQDHKDWVGFSCAVVPDWIDSDVYQGGHEPGLFKPREGTHINIENRALNGKDHLFQEEVAGAVGWSLGFIAPNETVKRTVAFMFCYGGKEPVRHHLYVTQTDDINNCFDSTDPDATITCTIHYGNDDPNGTASTETNLILTDFMPQGIDPFSIQVSSGGSYNLSANTVTWPIGTLNDGQSGQKTVSFKMSEAPAGGNIETRAVLANDVNSVQYTLETPICDIPAGAVVYVDKFSPGQQDGSSWYNAFHDLQAGLDKAAAASTPSLVEVWVADGTYKPGTEDGDSFTVANNVKVYAGFGGWGVNETDKRQRNWKHYKTILSGKILSFPNGGSGEVVYRNNTVIIMGNNSVLDGAIVEEGNIYGIYGSGNSFSISNCIIGKNKQAGIYCENGNLTIQWCEIYDDGWQGVYHLGSNKLLTVKNCKIHDNQQDGILTDSSASMILNSLIYQNGLGSTDNNTYYGINLVSPPSDTVIRNNTIVQNINEGIYRSGGSVPTIKNCILYYNNDEGTQLAGLYPTQVTWCCISDCNDINAQHNINDLPGFVYADSDGRPVMNNYHLEWNSPCVDAGDSYAYTNESDMDGDNRIYGDKVEIGADEVSCTDTSHANDWNSDGRINMKEFAVFSAAWLTYDPNNLLCDPNNPNYVSDPNVPGYISQSDKERFNPVCDLNHDLDVDQADLIAFLDHWLWMACWMYNPYDFDKDGLVNYHEFQFFSRSWLSTPSNSSCPQCDLSKDNDNQINLSDLILFLDKAPWLYVSEWQQDILVHAQTTSVGQQQTPPPQIQPQMEPNLPPPPQGDSEPNTVVEEPSIEQQIADLQDSIAFLENLWETDPNIQQEISAEDWQAFMDSLYASLAELESQLPLEDPNELDPNFPFFGMGMMSQSGFGARGMLNESQSANQQEISELQDSIQFLESLSADPQFQQEINAEDWNEFMDSVYQSLKELDPQKVDNSPIKE
jgi:hypothetical protein